MCGAVVLRESPAPKVEGSIKPVKKVNAIMDDEHNELPRQDIVAAAVRMASALIVSEHLVRDKRAEFPEYAMAQEHAARAAPWKQGWARKPRRGHTYGANYVGEFKTDIEQWFGAGNVDKNSKVSPAQVCERIRLEHPNRYCVPSPWMVQNFYIALGQRKGGSDAGGGARGPKSRLPPEVVQLIVSLVDADKDVKPAAVKAIVRQRFPTLSDELLATAGGKVSSLKNARKKAAAAAAES
jgi:hypothetical protein